MSLLGSPAHHLILHPHWHLLIARVQRLHQLVLGLTSASLDIVHLPTVVWVGQTQSTQLAIFRLLDAFVELLALRQIHVLVDGLAMHEGGFLLEGHLHVLLRGLLEQVDLRCNVCPRSLLKVFLGLRRVDALLFLVVVEQLVHCHHFQIWARGRRSRLLVLPLLGFACSDNCFEVVRIGRVRTG